MGCRRFVAAVIGSGENAENQKAATQIYLRFFEDNFYVVVTVIGRRRKVVYVLGGALKSYVLREICEIRCAVVGDVYRLRDRRRVAAIIRCRPSADDGEIVAIIAGCRLLKNDFGVVVAVVRDGDEVCAARRQIFAVGSRIGGHIGNDRCRSVLNHNGL